MHQAVNFSGEALGFEVPTLARGARVDNLVFSLVQVCDV